MNDLQTKRIIIIAAGISGLAAGCYLQINGYDTEIFEQNKVSGGFYISAKHKTQVMKPKENQTIEVVR